MDIKGPALIAMSLNLTTESGDVEDGNNNKNETVRNSNSESSNNIDVEEDDDADADDDADEVGGLEALFEDWIVDNTETPIIVPQSSLEFTITFTAPVSTSPHDNEQDQNPTSIANVVAEQEQEEEEEEYGVPISLHFRQDPELRARELPDDGSCPLRSTLSETEQVSATGAVSWNGGVSLGHFCVSCHDHDRTLSTKLQQGASVVELGAGTGVCGLMVAAIGANVVLTDRDEILPILRGNAVLNRAVIKGTVAVQEYSWGAVSANGFPKETTAFDYILAADCVYDMEGIAPLLQAFCALSHQTAREETDVSAVATSKTSIYMAYDTAIGHYDVYKVGAQVCLIWCCDVIEWTEVSKIDPVICSSILFVVVTRVWSHRHFTKQLHNSLPSRKSIQPNTVIQL